MILINNHEYNLLLIVLNEYRNKLLNEEKSTDMINNLLLKVIDAPLKKKSIFNKENVSER